MILTRPACFPYTSDLVRQWSAPSLRVGAEHLAVKLDEACEAILTGYREGLRGWWPAVRVVGTAYLVARDCDELAARSGEVLGENGGPADGSGHGVSRRDKRH